MRHGWCSPDRSQVQRHQPPTISGRSLQAHPGVASTATGSRSTSRATAINSPTAPVSPIVDSKLEKKNFGFNTGGRGDIVVVRLFYEWPLVVTGLGYNIANLSGNKRLLSTMLAFRNEPF